MASPVLSRVKNIVYLFVFCFSSKLNHYNYESLSLTLFSQQEIQEARLQGQTPGFRGGGGGVTGRQRQCNDKIGDKTETRWAQDTDFRGIKKFSGGGCIESDYSVSPHPLRWFYIGFTLVLHWFYAVFTSVVRWLYVGFTTVLRWFYVSFTSVLRWFYIGFTLVLPVFTLVLRPFMSDKTGCQVFQFMSVYVLYFNFKPVLSLFKHTKRISRVYCIQNY